jgi:ABC-type transport system involved in multi-copper enzyme maturation permease subunit
MFGPPLALMTRSLRIDSRLLRTHLFRFLFALLLLGGLFWAHMRSLWVGAPGLAFFQPITWLNFVFVTLAGISFFATAITEEKDEATLGLLKMAGINPVALLLGKSTSRLITALLVLVVQIPFTLLATTLGGVTHGQVFAVYVALAAYMALVANVGLFCSVYASGSGRASGLMAVVLLLFLAGAPMAEAYLSYLSSPLVATTQPIVTRVDTATDDVAAETLAPGGSLSAGAVEDTSARWIERAETAVAWITAANPAPRLREILMTGFSESVVDYVLSYQVKSSLLVALAFFLLSWATFGFFTEERTSSGRLLAKAAGPPRWLRPRRAWAWPLVWKDFHFVTGGRTWMIGRFLLYGVVVATIGAWTFERLDAYRTWQWDRFGARVMGVMLVAVAIELSIFASRVFRDEVTSKALPMLMMLPRSVAAVAWSKVAGCLLGLFPAAAYFALGAALNPGLFVEAVVELAPDPMVWYQVGTFVLFLHVTALFSLVIKWGSLPLALFLVYFFQTCCMGPILMPVWILMGIPGAQGGYEFLATLPIIGVTGALAAGLQALIGWRLEQLATE